MTQLRRSPSSPPARRNARDSTPPDSTPPDGGEAASKPKPYDAATLAAVVFAVFVVAVLAVVDYLPTRDGPNAIFFGWLQNHFDDVNTHYRTFLRPGTPATALGFHLVFASLEVLLPWQMAVRVTLALTGLLFGSCYFWLVRTLNPRRWVVGLLGFALAPQWALYLGWFSFVIATGLSFAVLAMALKGWPWSSDRRFVIALLLTVVGVAHIVPALLLLAALLCLAVARAESGRRVREAAWLLAMAAPLFGILFVTVDETTLAMLSQTTAVSLGDRLQLWLRGFVAGPLWRGATVAALALAGAASAWRSGRSAQERGLAVMAAALLGLGLVLPLGSEAGEWLSLWLLPLGFMLGLALLPTERLQGSVKRAVHASLVMLAAASLLWAGWYNVDLRRRADGLLAGLNTSTMRRGPRAAIVLDTNLGDRRPWQQQAVPFSHPARHIGKLYAVAHGGIPAGLNPGRLSAAPFILSSAGRKRLPSLTESQHRAIDTAANLNPAERVALMRSLAFHLRHFDDVLVVGGPDDWTPLIAAGYLKDVGHKGLFIGRFEGCKATLVIKGAARRIRFFQGWQEERIVGTERVAKVTGKPPYSLRLSGFPCNGAWLQVAVERADGLHPCAEANPQGVIDFATRSGQPVVVGCTPR